MRMYSLNILGWYNAKERGRGRGQRVCRSGKDDGVVTSGEDEDEDEVVGGILVGREVVGVE